MAIQKVEIFDFKLECPHNWLYQCLKIYDSLNSTQVSIINVVQRTIKLIIKAKKLVPALLNEWMRNIQKVSFWVGKIYKLLELRISVSDIVKNHFLCCGYWISGRKGDREWHNIITETLTDQTRNQRKKRWWSILQVSSFTVSFIFNLDF